MKGCRSTISRSHILLVTKRFWVDVLRNASPRNDALSAGCVASASTATTDLSGRRARHWQTDRSDSPCRAGVRRLGKGQAPRRGLRPILLVDALVLGSGNPTPRQLSDRPSAPHAGKPEPSGPVPATQGSSEAHTTGSWRPYTWGVGYEGIRGVLVPQRSPAHQPDVRMALKRWLNPSTRSGPWHPHPSPRAPSPAPAPSGGLGAAWQHRPPQGSPWPLLRWKPPPASGSKSPSGAPRRASCPRRGPDDVALGLNRGFFSASSWDPTPGAKATGSGRRRRRGRLPHAVRWPGRDAA